MTTAIAAKGLSKRYRLGEARRPHETLIGQLSSAFLGPYRWLRRQRAPDKAKPGADVHWALRDVSFELKQGETLGIIGHNGAGKSTLLKILSRITDPTEGEVRVRGRMASLLEVGTGFHPELSGRDNVYMNAAILGMSRADITRRFDAIVEFSGVESFIDTPIKHFSSGMKVRLAFAVAAHLEPEILVIDEVLAVGDAAFQKKCLARVEEVSGHGRTVLFVSHDLAAVARLCQRVVVLDHGKVRFDGAASEGIAFYSKNITGSRSQVAWADAANAPGDDAVRLREVEILEDGVPLRGPILVRNRIAIRIRYDVLQGGRSITPSIHLLTGQGTWAFSSLELDEAWHGQPKPAGTYESVVWIPPHLLNGGSYEVGVVLETLEPNKRHGTTRDLWFSVYDDVRGDSAKGRHHGEFQGPVRPKLEWQTRRIN